MGIRTGLDAVGKRKTLIIVPARNRTRGRPHIPILTELSLLLGYTDR